MFTKGYGAQMKYGGGKGGSGVYQQIINLMPRHDVYIETHLGGGNILLRKQPAPRGSIAIEIDTRALSQFCQSIDLEHGLIKCINMDCVPFLKEYRWKGTELVYSDPPYLMSTRRTQKRRYRYEWTEADHVEFLGIILEVPAFVMVSGYDNGLYNEFLLGWWTHEFPAATRRGVATEKVWMNFDPTRVLKHEYTFAGDNFRERERIKRKARRWASNLAVLPEGERNFILQEIGRMFTKEFRHHAQRIAPETRLETASPDVAINDRATLPDASPNMACGAVIGAPESADMAISRSGKNGDTTRSKNVSADTIIGDGSTSTSPMMMVDAGDYRH